ncbi:hypothetical protein CAEBREN_25723 [Caenorhabditis brenneri]|uniref:Uncharacterized protein n=1 Tax=Caenorhabditis brenneri TaxID=135651 RepID=G0MMY5_CAEBE|nr:hypothetical protein CAEBREN_25723 [Caenorhabditis brenneri]
MPSQEVLSKSPPPEKRQRLESFGEDQVKAELTAPEWSDRSGDEEFDKEGEDEEQLNPPAKSIGEFARLLYQRLSTKDSWTERTPRGHFCLPCLEYKMANRQCSRQHTDEEDRMQDVWIEDYADDVAHPLSKQSVLKILQNIGEKWA